MIRSIVTNIRIALQLGYMQLFQRRKWVDMQLIIRSNLIAAFGNEKKLKEQAKLARKCIWFKYKLYLEYSADNIINNAGFFNFLLLKISQATKGSRFRISRKIHEMIQRRSERLKSNSEIMRKEYLRYHTKFDFENLQILDEILLKGKGALVCCFHTGQYRLIPDLLNSMGYTVNLLVDQKVYEEQFERIDQKQAIKKEHLRGISHFNIMVAEEPNIALQIVEKLRDNEIILFFLDGSKGSGDRKKKAIKVNFLKKKIYARKGAIQLALMQDSPIIPLVSRWRFWKPAQFSFKPPIETKSSKRDAETILRGVYSIYEDLICEEPWQWDQWAIAHRYWAKEEQEEQIDHVRMSQVLKQVEEIYHGHEEMIIKPNRYRMGLLPGNKDTGLMDLDTLKTYYIKGGLGRVCTLFKQNKVSVKDIKQQLPSEVEDGRLIKLLAKLKYKNFIRFYE